MRSEGNEGGGTGNAAPDEEDPILGVDLEDLKVLNRRWDSSHPTRHGLVLKNTRTMSGDKVKDEVPCR